MEMAQLKRLRFRSQTNRPGLLRLDLNEDPLNEWVARTVEASGITPEEIVPEKSESEDGSPQQIEIE